MSKCHLRNHSHPLHPQKRVQCDKWPLKEPGKTPWDISSGTGYPCAGNWIESLRHLCLESMCGCLLVFWVSNVYYSWWRYGQCHQRSLGSDSVYLTVNTNLCRNIYVQTPRSQVSCRKKSILNNICNTADTTGSLRAGTLLEQELETVHSRTPSTCDTWRLHLGKAF